MEGSSAADFGKEVIPEAISSRRVLACLFDGYWEDIGTIRSFHRAHLALASMRPPFNFYDQDHRVFSHPRFLPGSKVNACRLRACVLSDGCIVDDATVEEAIVGVRTIIGAGATIRRSVLMGADFFETDADRSENRRLGRPDVGVGPGCVIENAIIDKNARIGRGVKIINPAHLDHQDGQGYHIRDGIVVVPKDAAIADGTAI